MWVTFLLLFTRQLEPEARALTPSNCTHAVHLHLQWTAAKPDFQVWEHVAEPCLTQQAQP